MLTDTWGNSYQVTSLVNQTLQRRLFQRRQCGNFLQISYMNRDTLTYSTLSSQEMEISDNPTPLKKSGNLFKL